MTGGVVMGPDAAKRADISVHHGVLWQCGSHTGNIGVVHLFLCDSSTFIIFLKR